MLGASANIARPSYFVATYMVSSSTDFEVYFVNPTADEILGHKVYPSLDALPVTVDLVDVFRKPDDLPAVADEVIAHGAKTLWIQLGLWSDEAARRGHEAGLNVVMNRCLKIEHRALPRRVAPRGLRHGRHQLSSPSGPGARLAPDAWTTPAMDALTRPDAPAARRASSAARRAHRCRHRATFREARGHVRAARGRRRRPR